MEERYKIVTVSELAEMLKEKKFNESIDFTFDNTLEEDDEPTGWFGVKIVKLFSEPDGCIAIGYYGGGATLVRDVDSRTMEEQLQGMLWELSETCDPVEYVCVDLEKNNGD